MKPYRIAVDLDETIFSRWENDYAKGKFGKVLPGAKETLQKFKDRGWYVIIWTARNENEAVAKILTENGIPFDEINNNKIDDWDSSRKIVANVYLDDRGMHFTGTWDNVFDEVAARHAAECAKGHEFSDAMSAQDNKKIAEINKDDLKVDTYRRGGTPVTDADNCVRITHLPSGLVVYGEEERSQRKNYTRALEKLSKMLGEQG